MIERDGVWIRIYIYVCAHTVFSMIKQTHLDILLAFLNVSIF